MTSLIDDVTFVQEAQRRIQQWIPWVRNLVGLVSTSSLPLRQSPVCLFQLEWVFLKKVLIPSSFHLANPGFFGVKHKTYSSTRYSCVLRYVHVQVCSVYIFHGLNWSHSRSGRVRTDSLYLSETTQLQGRNQNSELSQGPHTLGADPIFKVHKLSSKQRKTIAHEKQNQVQKDLMREGGAPAAPGAAPAAPGAPGAAPSALSPWSPEPLEPPLQP